MALKYFLDSAAHALLPADVKAEYKQEGERFRLDVDGAVDKKNLEEFRDKNIVLTKDLERFKDIDPVKAKELAAMENDLRAGKLKDGKTVEEILTERTGTMKADYDKRLAAAEGEAVKAKKELARLKISDAALLIGTKKGLIPTAADDLKWRAEQIFRLDDNGQPVAMEAGDKPMFGKTGSALTIEEWIEGQMTAAPHLFKPSTGSGAGGGETTSASGVVGNPFKKGTPDYNLTKQGELLEKNPTLYHRLKAEAGGK